VPAVPGVPAVRTRWPSYLIEHHAGAVQCTESLPPPAVQLRDVQPRQLRLRLTGRGVAGVLVISDNDVTGAGEACAAQQAACGSGPQQHVPSRTRHMQMPLRRFQTEVQL
jgi:hypothetical protein